MPWIVYSRYQNFDNTIGICKKFMTGFGGLVVIAMESRSYLVSARSFCCVFGSDTSLSQCMSLHVPRFRLLINTYPSKKLVCILSFLG